MQEFIDILYVWLQNVYSFITIKAVTVILIVFLGFVLGKIIEHALKTFIRETPFEKDIKHYLHLKRYPSEIIGSLVGYVIDFGVFVAVLYVLNLTRIAFYSLTVVALIVLVVYILLNFKELGPNAYAYVRLMRDYDMKEGKRMTLHSVAMTVKKIDTTQVTCRTAKGDVVTVYNKTVLKQLSKRKRYSKKKEK